MLQERVNEPIVAHRQLMSGELKEDTQLHDVTLPQPRVLAGRRSNQRGSMDTTVSWNKKKQHREWLECEGK